MRTLHESEVDAIRDRAAAGESSESLAHDFDIDVYTVWMVKAGQYKPLRWDKNGKVVPGTGRISRA